MSCIPTGKAAHASDELSKGFTKRLKGNKSENESLFIRLSRNCGKLRSHLHTGFFINSNYSVVNCK